MSDVKIYQKHMKLLNKQLVFIVVSCTVAFASGHNALAQGPRSNPSSSEPVAGAFARATAGIGKETPSSIDRLSPQNAEMYFNRAVNNINSRNFALALTDMNKAIALRPSNPNFFKTRAACFGGMKDYLAAILDLNEAIRLDPLNPEYFYRRSVAYEFSRQFGPALADANRAIQLRPNDPDFLLCPAEIYADLKNWSAAIDACTKCIAVNPTSGLAYALRAEAKRNAGDVSGGKEDDSRAFSLGYRD